MCERAPCRQLGWHACSHDSSPSSEVAFVTHGTVKSKEIALIKGQARKPLQEIVNCSHSKGLTFAETGHDGPFETAKKMSNSRWKKRPRGSLRSRGASPRDSWGGRPYPCPCTAERSGELDEAQHSKTRGRASSTQISSMQSYPSSNHPNSELSCSKLSLRFKDFLLYKRIYQDEGMIAVLTWGLREPLMKRACFATFPGCHRFERACLCRAKRQRGRGGI